jgi:hypothetical protein
MEIVYRDEYRSFERDKIVEQGVAGIEIVKGRVTGRRQVMTAFSRWPGQHGGRDGKRCIFRTPVPRHRCGLEQAPHEAEWAVVFGIAASRLQDCKFPAARSAARFTDKRSLARTRLTRSDKNSPLTRNCGPKDRVDSDYFVFTVV